MKLNVLCAALLAALPAAVSAWRVETRHGDYTGPNDKFSGCIDAEFVGPIKVSDLHPSCFFIAFSELNCQGEIESYITENKETEAGPSQSFSEDNENVTGEDLGLVTVCTWFASNRRTSREADTDRISDLIGTIVRRYASRRCQPTPLPGHPTIFPESHVSVIVATIDVSHELIATFQTMIANHPKEILIVTTAAQMAHGIQYASGEIIVLADDDVFWPSACLRYLLAVFEQYPTVGGVSSLQKAHGLESCQSGIVTMWEAFMARRLDERNVRISSSTYLDGCVNILSGRTTAYRSVILKEETFLHAFTNEYWLFGRYYQVPGDDQFITRWLLNHDWNSHIQTAPQALISTASLKNYRHIYQILRWTRNTKRSNIKRLFTSRRMWKFPYLSYTTILSVFHPILDIWKLSAIVRILSADSATTQLGPMSCPTKYLALLGIWFPRFIEHLLYGLQHPWWLRHIWAQMLKDLLQAIVLTPYAVATLHNGSWGSRDIEVFA
ncbi:hypothetical protein FE257_010013 [Aspergillus nanangensis]|uniref:Glycosyltransferase family 2 protein n=1 Tax=Aspergillus nanangensis TaxID=2582783 RepID=A0AAD4CWN6_ASPNN|nr:hypothetical protein FE257_010013 [Aspergillus nanangensis]